MKKILVIDDEVGLRELLEGWLSRDYEVLLAADGLEGIEILRRYRPDLVLLDITMPKMDGWAVLRSIRQEELTRDLPVIMLTARGDMNALMESKRLRADDHMIKPVVLEELAGYIKRYL